MLFNGADNPQNANSPWGILNPSNTWFPGVIRLSPPPANPLLNGISFGSAVFAGLTNMTNRQTHRQTDKQTDHGNMSVAIGRYRFNAT